MLLVLTDLRGAIIKRLKSDFFGYCLRIVLLQNEFRLNTKTPGCGELYWREIINAEVCSQNSHATNLLESYNLLQ